MDKQKLLPFAAIIMTAIVWGLSFLSIKVSVAVLPPITLALARFLIASVLLFIVMRSIEPGTKLEKKDIPLMVLTGIIGVTFYFYFENNGVKYITASSASIIISTVPIFTLIADWIFFKNPMNKEKLFSVLMSIIGVYLVVGGDLSELVVSGSWFGYLMMICATVSWVIYSIITKPLFKRYSQLAIVYYQTIFGTIAFIPFALFEKTDWDLVSIPIILNVVFLGVFCSALAYYFYAYAMDKLGIGIPSLFMNLVPVIAVTASFFILNERITIMQVIGGIIVIISIYFISWDRKAVKAEV